MTFSRRGMCRPRRLRGAGPAAGPGRRDGVGRVDFETDRLAGDGGLALRLGRRRAEALLAGLDVALVALVAATVMLTGGTGLAIAALAAGTPLVLWASAAARSPRTDRRERAWEAEAIGLVLLAATWLACTEPGVLR